MGRNGDTSKPRVQIIDPPEDDRVEQELYDWSFFGSDLSLLLVLVSDRSGWYYVLLICPG